MSIHMYTVLYEFFICHFSIRFLEYNFVLHCDIHMLFPQNITWNLYFKKPEQREEHFLSHIEERTLLRFYELQLRDFCRRFTPSMPRATVATALHYFKRFYLRNSVMDYHPKEILVTCVYLACKVIILSPYCHYIFAVCHSS